VLPPPVLSSKQRRTVSRDSANSRPYLELLAEYVQLVGASLIVSHSHFRSSSVPCVTVPSGLGREDPTNRTAPMPSASLTPYPGLPQKCSPIGPNCSAYHSNRMRPLPETRPCCVTGSILQGSLFRCAQSLHNFIYPSKTSYHPGSFYLVFMYTYLSY